MEIKIEYPIIDWDKPQLLESINPNDGKMILTNGEHCGNVFEGTSISSGRYPIQHYYTWAKYYYKPFLGKLKLKN